MLSDSLNSGSATPRRQISSQPETKEQAWQILRGYPTAHPLQPALALTIPIGTPVSIITYLHSAVLADINDASNEGDVSLPNFPLRNRPNANDDYVVLWQYYRQGYAYGMNQRMARNTSQPLPSAIAQTEQEPKPKMAPPKIFKPRRRISTLTWWRGLLLSEIQP